MPISPTNQKKTDSAAASCDPFQGFPEELVRAVSDARADCSAANAKVADRRNDLQKREERLAEAGADLARLLNLEKDDLVARILEGKDSRPQRPRRMTRIENLKQEIEGLKLAMPVLRGAMREAEQELATANEAYNTTILPLICAERSSALAALRSKLSELAPVLARLTASDLVQEKMIGHNFTIVGAAADVFSGRIITQRFVQQLSDRLRTPDLALDIITTAAERAAAQFTRAIQGD